MVAEHSPTLYRPATRGVHAVRVMERALGLDRLRRLYEEAGGGGDRLARALELLRVSFRVESGSLDFVPRTGPVLVTANHPFGLLEGLLLAVVLRRIRPDVRILANSVLRDLPELRDVCIFADLSGQRSAVAANSSALKQCLNWVDGGGLLVTFPAGEVSHLRLRERTIADGPWNPSIARLAQRTGAKCVPIHFRGANSAWFQAAGLVHPWLRTLQLPRELFNKQGRTVAMRVGRPIAPATLRAFPDAAGAIAHLRRRTDSLGVESPAVARPAVGAMEPIADAVDPALLEADVAALPVNRKLCENGSLQVWLGSAAELPQVLREIGRLREISFRGAGEGTGHSRDLDRFDPHYLHLFLWNAGTREVAGAYRLAATPDVLPQLGPAGLYTSTLFRYDPRLFERIGPAIELGRSFVRPEYQKQYAPLLLLWKGIGRYAASRPECPVLFGAVSISDRYTAESRALIVGALERHRVAALSPLVTARHPFRPVAASGQLELDALGKVIADLEPDGKGVPILLKQYLRSGGKVLGFNLDPKFSNALDALMLVDLNQAAPSLKARLQGAREPIAMCS